MTPSSILQHEHKWLHAAYKSWNNIPNLCVLGKSPAERLPIFSLVITHPECGKFIHHNFVSALLNDLFGVQARGGCACAGPYAEVDILFYVIALGIIHLNKNIISAHAPQPTILSFCHLFISCCRTFSALMVIRH